MSTGIDPISFEVIRNALVAATRFQMQDNSVGGYLVVAVGVNSITTMARSMATDTTL